MDKKNSKKAAFCLRSLKITYHLPRDIKTNNIGGVSKKVIGLLASIIDIDAIGGRNKSLV